MIRKVKVLIDMGMTLCLLLCMAYLLIGETLHEFIGTAMILLFLTHNILNVKWYGALFQGRYPPSRIFQAVVNLGCLLAMLGLAFSGMVLSRTVFSWVSLPGLLGTARVMHLFCSYWGFVLLSLHLGLHGSMVLGAVKKRREKELPPAGKWLLRAAVAGAAVYGLTAFLRQNIPSYLFLQNQFVFFDTEQPLALFFLDEAAMMTLWAVLAYYFKKALIAAKKAWKNQERGA